MGVGEMREIKFRAWSELDKEMFEVASIDLLLGLIVRQCENRIKIYVLEELVLMQYTGQIGRASCRERV